MTSVSDFAPRFGDSVCFKDASWDPAMRMSVTLINHHTIRKDDIIATVEVQAKSIMATYGQGEVCQVYVGDQDRNLGLLLIRVTKGAGSTR
jgi:hypothetical protein